MGDGDAASRRPRAPNRWGEGDRLRGEILAAAARVLSGIVGEDGLTLRAVAREIGIAPASVYQHFANRATLVSALVDHEYGRLKQLMHAADAEVAEIAPSDPVGRFVAQVHAYCTFAVANPGLYRVMASNAAVRPDVTAPPEGPLMDVIAQLATALARCVDAGWELRLPSASAAAVVFVGAHGRVALLHSNPGEHDTALIGPFVDLLLALVFVAPVDVRRPWSSGDA